MCSICRRTRHPLVVLVLLSQHKEENVPQHRERLPRNPRTLRSTNVMCLHTRVTIILALSCIYRFWMAAPCLRRFRQPSVSSTSRTFLQMPRLIHLETNVRPTFVDQLVCRPLLISRKRHVLILNASWMLPQHQGTPPSASICATTSQLLVCDDFAILC